MPRKNPEPTLGKRRFTAFFVLLIAGFCHGADAHPIPKPRPVGVEVFRQLDLECNTTRSTVLRDCSDDPVEAPAKEPKPEKPVDEVPWDGKNHLKES